MLDEIVIFAHLSIFALSFKSDALLLALQVGDLLLDRHVVLTEAHHFLRDSVTSAFHLIDFVLQLVEIVVLHTDSILPRLSYLN